MLQKKLNRAKNEGKMTPMEIINAFNDIIRGGGPSGRRITQAMISKKTGIEQGLISRMLSGKRPMSLESACSIANAIGARILVEGYESSGPGESCGQPDSQIYEAFRAAVENSKMLQEHIKWLEEQFNDLKRNSILITNPRKNLG